MHRHGALIILRGLSFGAGRVAEASPVYRHRHPERTPFYQLFQRHFDRYLVE